LRLLPFEKQQMEISNIKSQIEDRTARRDLDWAQFKELANFRAQSLTIDREKLGLDKERLAAGIAMDIEKLAIDREKLGLDRERLEAGKALDKEKLAMDREKLATGKLYENITLEALASLSPEDRQAAIINRFSPGVESNAQRLYNNLSVRYDNANKTLQSVLKSINDTAARLERPAFTYSSEQEALADQERINLAIEAQNLAAENFASKFGETRPILPKAQVIPIPGVFSKSGGGYQLVVRKEGIREILQELGIEMETQQAQPPKVEKEIAPTKEESKTEKPPVGRFSRQQEGLKGTALQDIVNPEGRKPRGVVSEKPPVKSKPLSEEQKAAIRKRVTESIKKSLPK
jgi:hypothetical protein